MKQRGTNPRHTARTVALSGLLFALALVLGYVESLFTPLLGLPPGVKLGLANIVVLYALLYLRRWQALGLVLLKAGFAFLTRGFVASMLSLAGGLLSFAAMALLLLPQKNSVWLVSVAGALAHNAGQLLVVRLWMGPLSAWYAPVLLLSGLAMGSLTALSLRALLPALEKTGLPAAQSNWVNHTAAQDDASGQNKVESAEGVQNEACVHHKPGGGQKGTGQ